MHATRATLHHRHTPSPSPEHTPVPTILQTRPPTASPPPPLQLSSYPDVPGRLRLPPPAPTSTPLSSSSSVWFSFGWFLQTPLPKCPHLAAALGHCLVGAQEQVAAGCGQSQAGSHSTHGGLAHRACVCVRGRAWERETRTTHVCACVEAERKGGKLRAGGGSHVAWRTSVRCTPHVGALRQYPSWSDNAGIMLAEYMLRVDCTRHRRPHWQPRHPLPACHNAAPTHR